MKYLMSVWNKQAMAATTATLEAVYIPIQIVICI